jgi:hypothetical protein
MHRFPLTVLALSATATLTFPGAAAVANVPPDNSAVDQYTEQIPGPTGNEPTGHSQPTGHSPGRTGGGSNPDRSLGGSASRSLESLGTAGRSAAQLAIESDPVRSPSAQLVAHRPGAERAAGSTSSGVLAVAKHALGLSNDEGGLGLLLPLIILGSGVSMVAYVLVRRKRSP